MEITMKKQLSALFLGMLVLALIAVPADARRNAQPTILDLTLAANAEGGAFEGQFDILIAAVLAADERVARRLASRGQTTVFAPTDAAFEAAFAELGVSAEDVLANKAFLTDVLEYHLVNGNREARSVIRTPRFRTIEGTRLMQESGVLTDAVGREATIIVTDVRASNGVIHAIDNVILPYTP